MRGVVCTWRSEDTFRSPFSPSTTWLSVNELGVSRAASSCPLLSPLATPSCHILALRFYANSCCDLEGAFLIPRALLSFSV